MAKISKDANGFALEGYDAVSLFDNRPVVGRDEFCIDWNGAKWKFRSAENRATFEDDPGKYAPQFGGCCAFRCWR